MRILAFILFLIPFSFIFSRQYYYVRKPVTRIYVEPDKSSYVLKETGFGEYLKKTASVKKKKHWLYVSDFERLSGWIPDSELTAVDKDHLYDSIISDLNGYLGNSAIRFDEIEKITEYLFKITESPEFTGDQFLYLKIKGGIALSRTLSAYNEASAAFREKKNFIKNKYSKYVREENGKLYLDPDYFWTIAEVNRTRYVGDYAAYLGVRYYRYNACDSVTCLLDNLNRTKIRYMATRFNGNYARRFNLEISQELDDILAKKDYCRDFGKTRPVIEAIKKQIAEIPGRYAQPISRRMDTMLEDCSP